MAQLADLYFIIVFIFGLFIGSFLNVVIYRFGTGHSIVSGRSHCMTCNKALSAWELIPVLSYIFLGGRCRNCKTSFSPQYFLVELISGLSFLAIFYTYFKLHFGFYYLALYLAIFSIMLVIAVYDLRHKIIPDQFSIILGLLTFLLAISRFYENNYFSEVGRYLDLLAGPIFFLPFYFLWKFSDGRWMGLGDGKLAVSIGFLLGFTYGLTALALSFWIGAIVSLILIFLQKVAQSLSLRLTRYALTIKSEVPFAPYLIVGAIVNFFWHLDLFSLHLFF